MTTEPADTPAPAPSIQVRGNATPEEVAAVVAVLLAAASGAAPVDEATPSRWASRAAALRTTTTHGAGAWRHATR